jgi:uncharacterized protein
MKVLIFSHESDLDGLFSAAIGLIRYPQASTIFLGNGRETFQTISYFMNKFFFSPSTTENGLVIICDLALSEDTASINICKGSFSEAKDAGYDVVWLDHHPWSVGAKVSIQPYAELKLDATQSKCASELVYEKFLPGNELAFALAKMAHSMDFFKGDVYLTPISELIVYYHSLVARYEKLSSLAIKVSRGILWDLEMQKDYMFYSQLRDRAKIESYQTLDIRHFGNKFNAAIVKSSPYIQNSLFAHEIFDKTGSDIVLLYGPDNRVSIRRNNDQISCRKIALNFADGGGHDFAAGAKFKSAPGDHDQMMREFEEALSKAVQNADPH